MITIDFTYQTVTPDGDFSESGFIMPGMWKFSVENYDQRNQWEIGDLAGLISFAESLGICCNEGADWMYSVDPDIDYATGEETQYAMHISGASPSTVERIHRLLTH